MGGHRSAQARIRARLQEVILKFTGEVRQQLGLQPLQFLGELPELLVRMLMPFRTAAWTQVSAMGTRRGGTTPDAL